MIATDSYLFRRLLVGHQLNGDLTLVSDAWRPLAELMEPKAPAERLVAWEAALLFRPDHDRIRQEVMAMDPNGPLPPISVERFANAGDVRRHSSSIEWKWRSWIPDSSIFGVAAFEGVGKTRLLLDLARRTWFALEWPDGQPATFPPGTPTLWVCADGHQAEIAAALAALGLPDEAVIFPAPPDNPFAGTDLDEPETFAAIDRAMTIHRPALTYIDTLTYATTLDLCEQRTVAALKTPLLDLCKRHKTTIGLSLHVSKEGQALGRRIKGITRTLIHLECPDPAHPERLKLWVEKSYDQKPAPLGVTIGADGNTYDFNPPTRPGPTARGGRPPEKLDKAIAFLVEKLTDGDEKACDLIREWEGMGESKSTLFRAKNQMVEEGKLAVDDGKKPQIWHLIL